MSSIVPVLSYMFQYTGTFVRTVNTNWTSTISFDISTWLDRKTFGIKCLVDSMHNHAQIGIRKKKSLHLSPSELHCQNLRDTGVNK